MGVRASIKNDLTLNTTYGICTIQPNEVIPMDDPHDPVLILYKEDGQTGYERSVDTRLHEGAVVVYVLAFAAIVVVGALALIIV